MKSQRLRYMMKNLSPGYLRIGGTMADRLIFVTNQTQSRKVLMDVQDGSDCAYEQRHCSLGSISTFTLLDTEWLELYELSYSTGFIILFDLNVLIRKSDGSWDYENAEKLIKFSNDNNMNVIWQLGNEPNSFQHVFNYSVNASQLALDFLKLKGILNKYPLYRNVLMVGPDVTRPRPDDTNSIAYLKEFLAVGGGHIVNAVTFHQYYFNGRNVVNVEFLDPRTYDLLRAQIDIVKGLVSYYETDTKPIWLTETADAYGGGAPGYSNRYIGTFIWLDKLGIAAKMGLDVVVRQTLFKGFYALIDYNYDPTPNYWISVIYKAFVGPEVVPCIEASSEKVRLYCQCTNKNFRSSSVTLFGFNLKDSDVIIRVEGLKDPRYALDTIYAYVLSPYLTLFTKSMYLNKEQLVLNSDGTLPPFKPKLITDEVHVVIPAYSSAFFVIPTDIAACH
ncbi:Glycosyl hydrolase family 79, N-terminal domain [Popillia japonica]|uniref:Glycosyl hydrolase family 79, N-terminal domain n=1 Tax=Popillia japonica TaxID=7064 RepID=A0AAW1KNS6_POPJA